jgi:hypothetical protein
MSTGITLPVTVPEPLPVNTPVSYVACVGVSWRSTAGKLNVTSTGSRVTW